MRGRKLIDPVVLAAFGCIIALLFVGSIYSANFLSPDYLLQQLQVASFLGIIASGLMLVILLGQIDLSIPWVVTIGGMMSTAAASWGQAGTTLAIPIGIACGLCVGLVNGIGVAYLRVPSMIFTLSTNAIAQGLMIVHTSGFAPQEHSTATMHLIAVGRSVFGIPNALWVWAIVGTFVVVLLTSTFLGTIAGVILITLLQSILSVVQVPEAGRQIIYGTVIASMLLLYGCDRLHQ